MLVNCSWAWDLLRSVVDMPSDTLLGRICSLSQQVLIINSFLVGLGLGVCVHFSELEPLQAGLNLSSLVHTVRVSVSSYVY